MLSKFKVFNKYYFVLILYILPFSNQVKGQVINEGFEGPFPPVGWLVYQNDCGTQVYWWQDSDPNDVCNGNNSAIILGNNVICGVAKDWLVTPQLAPTNQNYLLNFTMHQSYIQNHGSIYTLRVSTESATDTNDFQIVKTWTESQMPLNCTVTNFDFSNYIGDSIYVAFVMQNDEGDNWIIDDVIGLPMVGNCYPPTGLATFDVISTSAGLNWASIDTVSNYFWEVVPKGNEAGVGVEASGYIADTFDTASGLQMTTEYDYRVRSLCPSGDTSYYSYPFSFTTLGPPPSNDECSGAINLIVNSDNSCTDIYNATNLDATESMAGCIGSANDDVWFAFTAVSSIQDIQLQNITAVKGNSIDMVFEVFSGDCSNLNSILCSDDNYNSVSGLIQGNIYYLRVYSKYTTSNQNFDICIKTPPNPPDNDECSNSVSLIINPDNACNNITSGTTLGATESMTGCIGNADDDVWYSFTATAIKHSIDILNVIPVEGNNADMVHEIFEGTCGNLVSLKCSDQNYSSITGLTIGQTYYVRVYSKYSTSRQSFDICIKTPPTPPINDFCSNAIMINVGENGTCPANKITCSTENATNTDYGNCDNSGADPDLWYVFSVPINGDYTFSSISGNPGITLYKGDCDNLTEISCLNNVSGTLNQLETGITYYARIYTDYPETSVEFCIEKDPTPENNYCSNAIMLSLGQGYCDTPTVGSNNNATDSQVSPSPNCGNYNGGDVWYKVEVPLSGNIEIEMSRINNLQDGAMAVYSGGCGNMILVDCDDDSNDNPGTNFMPHISLTGQNPGDTLFIRVWEYNNDVFGNFGICVWEPKDIDVSQGGNCVQGQSVEVNSSNGNIYTWVPLKDNNGDLIAFVYPNGNELGNVTPSIFTTSNLPLRADEDGTFYINRDIQIEVENEPVSNSPFVRLLYTATELNDLISESSAVNVIDDMNMTKSENSCSGLFTPPGVFYTQVSNAEVNSLGDSYLEYQIPGFSTFYIHGGNVALPIDLSEITGKAFQGYNILYWNLFKSYDLENVKLQKSFNGISYWEDIYTMNDFDIDKNIFSDLNPYQITFYHLKMEYLNGDIAYSKVIRIENNELFNNNIKVFPNPNLGKFNLLFYGNNKQIQELYIYTANGMLAEKLKIKLLPKENVINLDLSYLNQGIYFIKIPILNKTIVKKIVITNDMGFN